MPSVFERFAKMNAEVRDKLYSLRPPKKRTKRVSVSIQAIDEMRKEMARLKVSLDAEEAHLRKTCKHADEDLVYKETCTENLYVDRMWDNHAAVTCQACGAVVAERSWSS